MPIYPVHLKPHNVSSGCKSFSERHSIPRAVRSRQLNSTALDKLLTAFSEAPSTSSPLSVVITTGDDIIPPSASSAGPPVTLTLYAIESGRKMLLNLQTDYVFIPTPFLYLYRLHSADLFHTLLPSERSEREFLYVFNIVVLNFFHQNLADDIYSVRFTLHHL